MAIAALTVLVPTYYGIFWHPGSLSFPYFGQHMVPVVIYSQYITGLYKHVLGDKQTCIGWKLLFFGEKTVISGTSLRMFVSYNLSNRLQIGGLVHLIFSIIRELCVSH